MFTLGQRVKIKKTDLNLFFQIAGQTGTIVKRYQKYDKEEPIQYEVKMDNTDRGDGWWFYEYEIEEVK